MKRLCLMAVAMLLSTFVATAQQKRISGQITDRDTREKLIMVTVQMLKADSSFVKGVLSDDNGRYVIEAPADGNYILRFSSVGYATRTRNISIVGGKNITTNVTMKADAIMLKEAVVLGQASKVTVKEDTFVYNASAYRTPEGSVVEELVKRLPGAKVDDEGNITVNGKEVKKILVDGKEFMTGDTKTALKNLPTAIIDKIKSYDEKSDLAKVTGIDDGEEQTVLDFGIKRGMNKGYMLNTDLSIGTRNRYAERLMGAMFKNNTKVMLFGNANNVNDRGFPGGGGGGRFGGGLQGLNATKMLGVNFNHENGDKFKLNGSVRWNHSDGDVNTQQSTENFVSSTGSFSNSINQSYTRKDSWDARLRLEWNPDSMTNILFRPKFSYSKSDSRSTGLSASFNEDPYLHVNDPLSDAGIAEMAADGLVVNHRNNTSVSYSDNKTVGAMLQYNRKLSNNGRNITFRGDISYNDADSKSLSTSNVHLYQIKDKFGNDSTYQTNRYNLTPTRKWSYSLQATYSEPIMKSTYLQFSYKFTYNHSKTDRSTYDFSNLGEDFFSNVSHGYRSWGEYLSLLENPLETYLDDKLSQYAEYSNYIHDMQLMLRIVRQKYHINVGVMVQPQRTDFTQSYQGVRIDTVRNVVNFSPTFDFRYRFSKISNLRINYRGTTSQPSMSDLIDITDDSDPLNITKGNPGLKPSFTNRFRLFYNTYIEKHQQAFMTNINYSNTRNSISNMVIYNDATGGRTTRPENINGNWDISGNVVYNLAVDSTGYWNISTFTSAQYNNYVGYLAPDNNSSSLKNTTRTTTLSEQLALTYRNTWLEVSLDGSVNYTHTRNLLQSQNNLDTWQFAYGGFVNLTLPWGTALSTDLHNNCRRGYNDNSMNTNELILNAQLSHSFLRGKVLTVSLQMYDILHRQSNFSRTINAMQRSDTRYNSINSYAMLHVVYRLNMFGGKNANSRRRQDRPDYDRPSMPPQGTPGMAPGMPYRGNGGFGRLR